MIKLEYTGPKAIISQHGIFFKNGKEDKYIYLKIATQILLSIDKIHSENPKFQHFIKDHNNLSDKNIIEILKLYEPNLENDIQKQINNYKQHINQEIVEVNNNKLITKEEQSIWIKNIKIMYNYMIQREVNKLCYIHLIHYIKEIIHKEHITEIDIDFDLKHWHILESIAGNLEYGDKPILAHIKVQENQNKKLIAKLFIELTDTIKNI